MKEHIFNILSMSSESMVNVPAIVKSQIAEELASDFKMFMEWKGETK